MSNLMKKFVAIATGLTLATMLFPVVPAQALTAAELQSQIDDLLATLEGLQDQLSDLTGEEPAATGGAIVGVPSDFTFDKALYAGMSDTDVKYLQIVLNSDGDTQLAETGAGSPGSETKYFGPITKAGAIKFQEKYADEVLASWGLTSGTGYVGQTTRDKLNSLLETDGEEPADDDDDDGEEPADVAAGLNVALSSDTPASQTVITYGAVEKQTQVLVPFTTVDFTAGSEGDVVVTTLKFKRNGISSDSNLDNTYLYEGSAKLIEGGSISSKYVTFNDSTGMFTVPAGETKSITLVGNLAPAASAGATMGFELVSDGFVSDASEVNGTFPLAGNLMSLANATDLGYLTVGGSYASPATETTIDPQDDYLIWKFTVTANEQNLEVEKLVFTEVGSIQTGDLSGLELYYGGTLLGTAEMDDNNQIIFDLSDSPFAITKGAAKILSVYADVIKGSARTFKLTFQYPTDIVVKDANYGVYVGSYIALASGWQLVQPTSNYLVGTGSMTVTKSTDSPSENVAKDATNVTLAKYDFKALGEDIKLTNLRIAADTTHSTPNGLDNGKVYLNGVQVGSTLDINEYVNADSDGTTFSFGNSFIVSAGETATVEIKADVKTKAGASFSSTNTIEIYLMWKASYDNAQAQNSLTVLDIPGSDKDGNSLSVQVGSLTFTESSSYGDQTTVRPATAYKIGSFSILAGSAEGVSVDGITVIFDSTEEADIENLMLKIGGVQIGTTKANPSTSNLFSVSVDLTAGESKLVDVYADILSDSATPINATTSGTGSTINTSTAVTASAILLQDITIGTSALTVAKASDSPVGAVVVGDSADTLLSKFTFSSTYEAFTVNEMRISVPSTSTDNFTGIYLKYVDADSATITTPVQQLVSGTSTFVGQTMYVAASANADVEVYGNLNAVGAGYADAGDQPELELRYAKANSNSSSTYVVSAAKTGNFMLLYKSAPTVAISGASAATLTTVDNTLYSFSVKANAKGDIGMKQVMFNVTPNMSTTTDTIGLFKFYRGSTDITSLVTITEATTSGTNLETGYLASVQSATTVLVVFATEEVVTDDATQTYYLKAQASGVSTGDEVNTYISDDTSYAGPAVYSTSIGNFVWTDRSKLSHSESEADWQNGYLIDDLPTATRGLSK